MQSVRCYPKVIFKLFCKFKMIFREILGFKMKLLVVFFLQFDDAFKKSFVHVLNVTYSGTNKDLQNSFDALFKTVSIF